MWGTRLFGRRAVLDAVVLTVLGLMLWYFAAEAEVFELLYQMTRTHEDWDLDELLLALQVSGVMGFSYAVRRGLDLSKEIRLRNRAERDVAWIAQHDMLTKLPNRRYLENFVRGVDRNAGGTPDPYTVYAIDLDGFKRVNDLLGHGGGDKLLIEISERLRALAADDLVVRLGGDEFLIVRNRSEATEEQMFAEKVIQALSTPVTISGVFAEVGAGVGIAVFAGDGNSLADTIRCADVAMYAAKKEGRNAIRWFDPSMDDIIARRAQIEQALRQAIRDEEIVPHYQPLVDLETGAVLGFEALARWTRPDGEQVPPFVFVEFAEDLGLIVELSEKLLRRACQEASTWPSHMKLSFNISPTQLTDELLGLRVVRILEETGLSPGRLEIEVTENALMTQLESAVRVLGDLNRAGVHIALDDFGTGYSSLAQLSRFKFDKIKIDRSFVAEFDKSERVRTVVQAMVALGHGLGIATTAEGIEDRAQEASMRELGVDFGQGYLFGKAIPPEQISELLGAGRLSRQRSARTG